MGVRIDEISAAELVPVVNGWGTLPRRAAGEQDLAYPSRALVSGRLGVPASAEPASDRAMTRLADAVHPVFATEDLDERVLLVARMLAETEVRPTLVADGASGRAAWTVTDRRLAPVAAAAVALRAFLASHPAERLGVCAGKDCADAYVDASPGAHRRFCSVTCQNRARVAAFRSRRARPSR